jgi:CubicO group peptidase (beta-lactamase class C family)
MATETQLPRSRPEAQGISSSALLAFLEGVETAKLELHSVMVVRHGHVVAEGWWHPYTAATPHMLFSLSKSFTSTAIGIAVAEGRLSINDKVISFFPDRVPTTISENLEKMTVRDLLIMGTGHDEEVNLWASDGDWVRAFLAHPVSHEPGHHFLYNTPATYMQSAIVEKLTGESLLDYLRPRLFEPLGIENPTWMRCPQGIATGGYGLSIRTEDIAKFGQLYLQKGIWNGRQLVSADWVEEASTRQIDNGSDPTRDWTQGYGYQFWMSRHQAYRADGAFGQYCIVMPDQGAVIAVTAGLGDMQAVLNLIWDLVLPAMSAKALPESDASIQLNARLAGLSIAMPEGQLSSPNWAKIDGTEFAFDANEFGWTSLIVESTPQGLVFTHRTTEGERQISAGLGRWIDTPGTIADRGNVAALRPSGGPVSAQATYTDEATVVVRAAEIETPFIETFRLKIEDNSIQLESDLSAHFWQTHSGPVAARKLDL